MSSKICIKCVLVKPLTEFYPHKQMKDGHLNMCKVCGRRAATAFRAASIEYYRAYDRTRAGLPQRRANASEVIARWKRQFPKRRAAQVAVGNAVRDGRLEVWPCLICGAKAQAHHADYDNQLGVTWLCPAHHKQTHAMTGRVAP